MAAAVAASAADGDVLLFHNCNIAHIVRPKLCCIRIYFSIIVLFSQSHVFVKYSFQFDVPKSDVNL